MSSLEAGGQRRILDVGCGIKKFPGSIGLDHNPRSNADLLCELDHFPWPLQDQCFDEVRLIHVIEHVGDVVRTVEECHRLLRPGGLLIVETPHYTDFSSFCDPTHRWHLNSFSFRYFGEDNAGYGYYSEARFSEEKVVVKLLSLWRWLGLEWLVNQAKFFRKFVQLHFSHEQSLRCAEATECCAGDVVGIHTIHIGLHIGNEIWTRRSDR